MHKVKVQFPPPMENEINGEEKADFQCREELVWELSDRERFLFFLSYFLFYFSFISPFIIN